MKLFQSIRVPKKPRDSTVEEIFSFSSPLSRPPHNQQVTTPHTIPPNPLAAAKNKPIEKPVVKSQIPTINRSSTQTSLHKKDKVFKDEKLKTSKSSLSILPTKTELKHGKPSVLSGLSEKNRRNSEILIENEMKKVREKAARKFPTDEKEREKYIRKKQKKLKQRVEEVFGQTDTKKEVTAKKSVSKLKLKTFNLYFRMTFNASFNKKHPNNAYQFIPSLKSQVERRKLRL
jgi:hypothetical protein